MILNRKNDDDNDDDDDNEQYTALVSMITSLRLPQNVGNYLTENLLASQGHCSMKEVIKSVNKPYRYLCPMI